MVWVLRQIVPMILFGMTKSAIVVAAATSQRDGGWLVLLWCHILLLLLLPAIVIPKYLIPKTWWIAVGEESNGCCCYPSPASTNVFVASEGEEPGIVTVGSLQPMLIGMRCGLQTTTSSCWNRPGTTHRR